MPQWEFDFDRLVCYEIKDAYAPIEDNDYSEERRIEWAQKPIEEQKVYLLMRKGVAEIEFKWTDFNKKASQKGGLKDFYKEVKN